MCIETYFSDAIYFEMLRRSKWRYIFKNRAHSMENVLEKIITHAKAESFIIGIV